MNIYHLSYSGKNPNFLGGINIISSNIIKACEIFHKHFPHYEIEGIKKSDIPLKEFIGPILNYNNEKPEETSAKSE